MRKAQINTVEHMIIILFASLLVIGLLFGMQRRTGDYVKEQTVQVQLNRLVNAAMILDSAKEGHIEVEMDGYKIAVEDDFNITVGFEDSNRSRVIDTSTVSYDSIEEMEFQKVEYVCVSKSIRSGQQALVIEPGRC